MHFEVPKSKSLREFGGEYLMIVISIATALGIEHMVQTVHHRHKAEEAAQSSFIEPFTDRRDRRHHGRPHGVHHVVGVALQQGAEH